jgi:hypothetical protein
VSAAFDRRTPDPYWNARFGAYRTIRDIETIDDATAFFQIGRGLLTVR